MKFLNTLTMLIGYVVLFLAFMGSIGIGNFVLTYK